MKVWNIARGSALAVLTATATATAPAPATPRAPAAHAAAAAVHLPICSAGRASTRPPTRPAGPRTPGACRATTQNAESTVRITKAGFTPTGYHHLGANSAGEWSGISGRFSVVNGSVRAGSYDFIAGRFMVKRNLGSGKIAWLEAGWAETGWAAPGRQHIYTFNSNSKAWQFYDQYTLRTGDRAWFDLHSDTEGVWGAWLWWNNRWNLLTAQRLPIGATAYVEQYVEVHVGPGSPTRVAVPPVTVDNVRLRPPGGGPARFWRSDVPTLTGSDPAMQQRTGGFCLNWLTRYDTWTAGNCTAADVRPPPVAGVGGLLGATVSQLPPTGQ